MRTVTTNRLAFKLTLGTNEEMISVFGGHGEKTSEDFSILSSAAGLASKLL